MSIYHNSLNIDLSYELQSTLRRNGMQAHIVHENGGYVLAVQGHDSPLLTYNLTNAQVKALMNGGTNSSNKRAYNTFASIVKNDFDMPKNWIHAREANGSVVLGLHGYRCETPHRLRPYMPYNMWSQRYSCFLGWTPRHQPGFHGRLVGGAYFGQDNMIPVRPGGYMRPGELQSGGYGFYWKGPRQQTMQASDYVVSQLQNTVPQQQSAVRPTIPAKPYSSFVISGEVRGAEKWKEIFSSHGIKIDANEKTLTIQSSSIDKDFVYDLTDEEVAALTSPYSRDSSLETRLSIINDKISAHFSAPITAEMMESTSSISLPVKEEVRRSLESRTAAQDMQDQETLALADFEVSKRTLFAQFDQAGIAYVDGSRLPEEIGKGWYREGANGREVSVDAIWVEAVKPGEETVGYLRGVTGGQMVEFPVRASDMARVNNGELSLSELLKEKTGMSFGDDVVYEPSVQPTEDKKREKDKETDDEVKYKMTAIINGSMVSHEITKKQYEEFHRVDDYHRMKLCSKVFDEMDMKNIPGLAGSRMSFLEGLAVTLGIMRGTTYAAADIAHNIEHIRHPHPDYSAREVVSDRPVGIYVKQGLDTPASIAARAYDKGVNDGLTAGHYHRGL